jgi:hypothetical protein
MDGSYTIKISVLIDGYKMQKNNGGLTRTNSQVEDIYLQMGKRARFYKRSKRFKSRQYSGWLLPQSPQTRYIHANTNFLCLSKLFLNWGTIIQIIRVFGESSKL